MNRRTNRGSAAGFIACGLLVFFVLALVWSGRKLEGQNFPTIGQMPTSTGGGGSVSNYNQANPLQFNTLTATNGITNSSLTAPILSAAGFISSGGSPGILISNTMGAGGDYIAIWTNSMWFCTNAELGKWTAYTNGVYIQSNALAGAYSLWDGTNFVGSNSVAYMSITNGHLFVTNYTAAGQSVDIDPTLGWTLYGSGGRTNYFNLLTTSAILSNSTFMAVGGYGADISGLITNETGMVWPTNVSGTGAYTAGGHYSTNLSGNATLAAFAGVPINKDWDVWVYVTNTSASASRLTFANGITGCYNNTNLSGHLDMSAGKDCDLWFRGWGSQKTNVLVFPRSL